MAKKRKRTPKSILKLPDLEQSKSAVLNSLPSVSSQRSYDHAIRQFIDWYCSEPRLAFNRIVVTRYRIFLEQAHYASSTINLRLAAVRRLAYEASDAGLLSPDLAAGIRRVKGAKKHGIRVGNWLKPIDPAMVLIGRAMPVLEADFFAERTSGKNPLSSKPFGLMFEALDDLAPHEIYICAGGSHRYALWGGLMSTRALQCGAAGAVVHGFHRDTKEILRLGFPVASFGSYAQDQGSRGKVIDWRVPIELNSVAVRPRDVIYGDLDGVIVVPAEAVEQAFAGAIEKVRGERNVMAALQNGMTAAEAFRKFGIM